MSVDKFDNPRELFELAYSEHRRVEEGFISFIKHTEMGKRYSEELGNFVHDASRDAGNLKYCLRHNDLPEAGRVSPHWGKYNSVRAKTAIMKIILDLYDRQKSIDGWIEYTKKE